MPNPPDNDKLIDINKPKPHYPHKPEDISGTGSFVDEDPAQLPVMITHSDDSDWVDWDAGNRSDKKRSNPEYRPPAWESYAPLVLIPILLFWQMTCDRPVHENHPTDLPLTVLVVFVVGIITWIRYRFYPQTLRRNIEDPDYFAHRMEGRCLFQLILFFLLPIIIFAIIFFSSSH
jgi:hypothetical protein